MFLLVIHLYQMIFKIRENNKGEIMAFGDNGKRKKTFFEKLTMFVVLIMLFVTLAGIFATAIGVFSRF